ncbi:hypothetical protein FHQ18_07680 [Deferribacter autotrophicus]|uniref:Uncharacterized protein n=1 Tax=Deferribacter autotrophicus TaxID=500465 RepID=A0A5A8F2I5_9BACT|nr:hypothetical protein [Deferribacter autotrophicus]KAA0257617.1 hypothetical protein FHQ18_07680 [Deferribacter autotrophicus]
MSPKRIKAKQFLVGHIWFPSLSYKSYINRWDKKRAKKEVRIQFETYDEKITFGKYVDNMGYLYRFSVEFGFKIIGVFSDKKDDKEEDVYFEMLGTVNGDIFLQEKVEDEKVVEFFDNNKNIIILPYIRTTVDDVLVKAGLPPYGMILGYQIKEY